MFLVRPTCVPSGGWMDVFLLHSRLRRGRKRASVGCGAPQDRPAAERTIPAGYELVKRNINRSKPDQIKQVRRDRVGL